MRIQCIAVENYKLTEGKIYNSESESRDFYKLLNDNNIGVRYAKRLFTEVVVNGAEEPPRPIAAVPPPPPPALTEADLVNSIEINNNSVSFVDFDRQRKHVANCFSRDNSAISCGVTQISGINPQIQEVDSFFDLDDDDFITIRKALFRACIQEYVRSETGLIRGFIFGMLSTNISDNDLLSILDELADTATTAKRNPNSGNEIKVWVMSKTV